MELERSKQEYEQMQQAEMARRMQMMQPVPKVLKKSVVVPVAGKTVDLNELYSGIQSQEVDKAYSV